MRILLYTGKGGVGKTSVSAATALRCAELGYRTIVVSTDSAHSLADSFDMPLEPEPTPIAANLHGQEIDVLYQMDKHWGDVQTYMASVFAWQGLAEIISEELTVLPGMEELASLLEIVHLYDSGAYDVIVMDCAPTGATLQLLTIPEIGRWYLQKIFPLEKKALALGKPLLRAITDLPIPDEQVFDAIEQLITHLDRMQALLTDREHASVRLVLNPAKMVIKEAQRAYTYLNLYGYPTDAIICNRILPAQMQDTYLGEWVSIQERYQQMVHDSFAPLPILQVPYFDREVVGLDMLRRMGQALFADRDPADVLYVGQEPKITRTDDGYILHIPLPFVKSADVQLTRSSADELIVHIGNHKRVIALSHTLSAFTAQKARYQDDTLLITFTNN
ncbi:MAG: ArsA family ATPase [Anaerolineae bacterium]|nr:ArsA family ATPase [Anaerolineae bacterium]